MELTQEQVDLVTSMRTIEDELRAEGQEEMADLMRESRWEIGAKLPDEDEETKA